MIQSTSASTPPKFHALMGKKRSSALVMSLQAKVNHHLRNTFERVVDLTKQAMQQGTFNHELLESFRHVPNGVWKKHYSCDVVSEKHYSITSIVITSFAQDAAFQNIDYSPWLDDALMQQSLIAELQKVGREFREFRAGKWRSEPQLIETELDELYHALKTLKEFLKQARRFERHQLIQENESLQLQRCVDEFLSIQNLGSGRAQYELSFRRLVNFFGPTFLVTELRSSNADVIIEHLRSIPRGRPRWISDGKNQVLMFSLSAKTVNKHISNYHVFYKWLINRNRYQENNPFAHAKLPRASKYSLSRRSFVTEEIERIVNYKPKSSKEAKHFRTAAKWVPLLCLYTGMRPVEIATLRLIQIRHSDGIDYISLTEQRGKTQSSRRLIPIHSQLKLRGFMDYVQALRKQGEAVVFPDLYENAAYQFRDKALDRISKWFNRTAMPKMGFDKEIEISFGVLIDLYCCRHTVASLFKEKGAIGYIVKSILGHYPDDEITFGVYGGKQHIPLAVLSETIELLDYGMHT